MRCDSLSISCLWESEGSVLLTLHGSGQGIPAAAVLPEDELAARLEQPVHVPDLIFEIGHGTL